jgi:hypothetical protein
MRYFLLIAFTLISCEREPEFFIDGKGYYTRTKCLRDSTWTTWGFRYGLSLRGKYEWSYGTIDHYECLSSKIDTFACNN